MPTLSIAKELDRELTMPSKDNLMRIKKMASTPESAHYVVMRIENIIKTNKKQLIASPNKLQMYEDVLGHFQEHEKYVTMERDRASPFTVKEADIKTDVQNLQHNLAEASAKILSENLVKGDAIKVDFAVNADVELLRAFSKDGKPLDQSSTVAVDNLLNYCFYKENYLSKDGVVYEALGTDIKVDKVGNPITAPEDRVAEIISKDLPVLIETKLEGKEISVSTKQHGFPVKTPAVEVAPKVVEAVPAAPEAPAPALTPAPTPAPAEEPSIEPGGTNPSSTTGGM